MRHEISDISLRLYFTSIMIGHHDVHLDTLGALHGRVLSRGRIHFCSARFKQIHCNKTHPLERKL